jgi:hypothetical protein
VHYGTLQLTIDATRKRVTITSSMKPDISIGTLFELSSTFALSELQPGVTTIDILGEISLLSQLTQFIVKIECLKKIFGFTSYVESIIEKQVCRCVFVDA